MFSSVGWGEMLILLAAALIILGPERLPGAVSWTMQSIKKVRDYATGASSQLRDELGDDFDQIREPLSQINELRQMSPKNVVTKHLFNGDSSTVDDLGKQAKSVRDSFTSMGGALGATPASPSERPAPAAPEQAAAPEEPRAPRAGDITDWDAT